MLRAHGRNVEAEAALRAATRVDSTFADAWYNLSDLLDDQGRVETAIECLRTALRVAPDYADAVSILRCYYNEPIRRSCKLLAALSR
jgi:tetratricopeptide (TPR) repeat protein